MSTKRGLQLLATLFLVEGTAAFVCLFSLPTNRQIFSISRLAGLASILVVIGASAGILLYLQRDQQVSLVEKLKSFKHHLLLSSVLLVTSMSLWSAIFFKEQWLLFVKESTYFRLLPILIYFLLILFQSGLFLLLSKYEKRQVAGKFKSFVKPVLFFWGIFLAIWLFSSFTGIGFLYDPVGLSWGPPGTPITFAQVQLVVVASFIVILAWCLIQPNLQRVTLFPTAYRNTIIFLALWGLAVRLWSNQPMSPTHFTPPPMPPNYETYPYSDAALFDSTSYQLLYGTGFADQLARRPLYVGMLALFHSLIGGSYEKTVFLQILILALIPGLIFLFTSRLSNPVAGMIAGGLVILREKNSIELSGEIVTSHAKLMMSDMIATLGVIIVLYLTIRWLFKEKPTGLEFIIIGSCLGLTALVRTQVLIIAVPLVLFMILAQFHLKLVIRNSLFILLGIILVLSSWIWRNWNLTGTLVLDDRGEERLLARNYSLPPFSMPSLLPGETEEEFSSRLKSDILLFVRTHPRDVLHFVSNHFFRNLATSAVYIAPIYSTDTPRTIIQHLTFWNNWVGNLTPSSSIALLINLGLIAFGIGVASVKNKWLALLPAIVFLFYSFGNAIVRSSGWRFNQPADWIIIVYYSMALSYLPAKISEFFSKPALDGSAPKKDVGSSLFVRHTLVLLALFMLGASVPIAERLIPPQEYDEFTEEAKAILINENIFSAAEIDIFLKQEKAVLLSGIAIYPRYVTPTSRFRPLETEGGYDYLHFQLLNRNDQQVVIPLRNIPNGIPHTSTVPVLGCNSENYISAFTIIVHGSSGNILIRDPQTNLSCPVLGPE